MAETSRITELPAKNVAGNVSREMTAFVSSVVKCRQDLFFCFQRLGANVMNIFATLDSTPIKHSRTSTRPQRFPLFPYTTDVNRDLSRRADTFQKNVMKKVAKRT